jgi:hypothetical protein
LRFRLNGAAGPTSHAVVECAGVVDKQQRHLGGDEPLPIVDGSAGEREREPGAGPDHRCASRVDALDDLARIDP